jgi:hypothetical protein
MCWKIIAIKTHKLYVNNFSFPKRAVYEVEWKNMVEPKRPQMTTITRRKRFACWITKPTNEIFLFQHWNGVWQNTVIKLVVPQQRELSGRTAYQRREALSSDSQESAGLAVTVQNTMHVPRVRVTTRHVIGESKWTKRLPLSLPFPPPPPPPPPTKKEHVDMSKIWKNAY